MTQKRMRLQEWIARIEGMGRRAESVCDEYRRATDSYARIRREYYKQHPGQEPYRASPQDDEGRKNDHGCMTFARVLRAEDELRRAGDHVDRIYEELMKVSSQLSEAGTSNHKEEVSNAGVELARVCQKHADHCMSMAEYLSSTAGRVEDAIQKIMANRSFSALRKGTRQKFPSVSAAWFTPAVPRRRINQEGVEEFVPYTLGRWRPFGRSPLIQPAARSKKGRPN